MTLSRSPPDKNTNESTGAKASADIVGDGKITNYFQPKVQPPEWQKVASPRVKRKRDSNGNSTSPKQTAKKNIALHNRFNGLASSADEDNDEQSTNKTADKTKEYKPPPVFLKNIVSYPDMIKQIKAGIESENFYSKTMSNGSVKVSVLNSDTYRKLIKYLNENHVAYFTYQLKEEKPFRVVIRNIHHTVKPDEIKEALLQEGFETRNVVNVKNWRTKEPLPMFFVDLEPTENVKKIYELEYLLYTKIKIEPPRPRKEIVQCMRCQQFGHTKSYCTLPPVCVRCGGEHDNRTCPNEKNDTPKCGLCEGNHPANYRGCPAYKNLIRSSTTKVTQVKKTNNHTINPLDSEVYKTRRTEYKSQMGKGRSYAEVTESKTPNREYPPNRLEEAIMKIVQQNSEILILLTKLVNKLLT